MNGIAATTLSIATIGAFLLIGAGVRFAVGRENRKQGLLMVAAGMVILGNVLIWTL